MKTTKIYGPPGTGKTTFLLATLKRLLDAGYHPSQVAYLSHSKAAAEEVADRITQQYASLNMQKDFPWFRTIHSACCRRLGIGRREIMSGGDYQEFSQKYGWPLKGIIDDLSENTDIGNYDLIINARSLASHWKLSMPETLARLAPNPIYRNWDVFLDDFHAYKFAEGKVDFVDMLEQGKALGPIPDVKVYIIDEGQDLSELQLELIRNWSQDADEVYIAGDDDQAIYTFLGSSENGFLRYKADETIVLDKSYRCPQKVGRLAEHIINRVKDRQVKDVAWRPDKGTVLRTVTWRMLPWRDALESGSVMVLCRHRKQAYSVGWHLLDLDVPCTILGKPLINEKLSDLVRTYFRLRRGLLVAAPDVANLLTHLGDTNGSRAVRALASRDHTCLLSGSDTMIDLHDPNWVSRMAAGNDRNYKDLKRISRLISIYGVDILDKKPNIEVTTYHQSKGREADTVILLTDCYRNTWEEQAVRPATETRLCYVGATRARDKLVICSPETDMYMRPLLEVIC